MTRNDRLTLLALLCLATAVQAAVVGRSVVPALDSVRFVQFAHSVQTRGLLQTMQSEREQPLFGAWLWGIHAAMRTAWPDAPSLWAVSAQVAAAAPMALVVLPIYLLARRLVGPAAASAGTVLFCLLPEMARLGAEGISDSLHLLLAAVALWLVAEAFSRGSRASSRERPDCGVPRAACQPVKSTGCKQPVAPYTPAVPRGLWVAAGLVTGLAAMVRAEALVVPAAVVATHLLLTFGGRRHVGLFRALTPTAWLTLGLAFVLVPYVVAAGARSPAAAVARLLGRAEPVEPPSPGVLPPAIRAALERPGALSLKEPGASIRRRGAIAGLAQFGGRLADAFGYGVGLLALVGLWRRRATTEPAARFVQVFFLLFSLAVIRFTAAEGYLAARHLAILVVVGTGAIGLGACELGRAVACWPRRTQPRRGWAWSVTLAASAALAVVTFQPLRAEREAYRRAGQWLASRADRDRAVLDTRGWTALYSTRLTYQYDRAQDALADPRLGYVVVAQSELRRASQRARTLREVLAMAGEPVARFSTASTTSADDTDSGDLVVYRWRRDRLLECGDSSPLSSLFSDRRQESSSPSAVSAQGLARRLLP